MLEEGIIYTRVNENFLKHSKNVRFIVNYVWVAYACTLSEAQGDWILWYAVERGDIWLKKIEQKENSPMRGQVKLCGNVVWSNLYYDNDTSNYTI